MERVAGRVRIRLARQRVQMRPRLEVATTSPTRVRKISLNQTNKQIDLQYLLYSDLTVREGAMVKFLK